MERSVSVMTLPTFTARSSYLAPELVGNEVSCPANSSLPGLLGALYLTYLVGSAHTTPQVLDRH